VSLGYNLTNSMDVFTATGDLTGTLPWLGPLQDNGGPTLTHALLEGSPGIDAGNPAGCAEAEGTLLTQDQRGYPRSADGSASGVRRCDIGAYERWVPAVSLHMPFVPTTE
jgi:hypothetical protein